MATHATSLVPVGFRSSRSAELLRLWAWATLAFFVIVVLEGAVVRATSSGAGCGAHWPLCNGEILPHHPRVATMIEFAHRSLTGISSMMFAGLVLWTFLAKPKRHPARRAAVISGVLLLSEALLGAMLVLNHWVENNASAARVLMQSVHFTNTLLLLGATAVTAVLLQSRQPHLPASAALRPALLLALGTTVLTGATGSLAALADTIFPSPDLRTAFAADFAANSPLLIRMRWMHPAAALLAAACAVYLALVLQRKGELFYSRLLAANVVMQLAIGLVDVLFLAPTWLQVLHLFSADIFWLCLVVLAVPALMPNWSARAAIQA